MIQGVTGRGSISRRDFTLAAACALAGRLVQSPRSPEPSSRPRPSPSQLAWQRDELALFLHFGVNTFTDREWGDGREDPAVFDPTRLDALEWGPCRQGRGRPRADLDRQTPRRLLLMAQPAHAALRGAEPVAWRRRRRGARVQRRLQEGWVARRSLPVSVGSQ